MSQRCVEHQSDGTDRKRARRPGEKTEEDGTGDGASLRNESQGEEEETKRLWKRGEIS